MSNTYPLGYTPYGYLAVVNGIKMLFATEIEYLEYIA